MLLKLETGISVSNNNTAMDLKIMSVHLEYLYVYVHTYTQYMDCKVLLTLQSGVMLLWSFHIGPSQPSAQC